MHIIFSRQLNYICEHTYFCSLWKKLEAVLLLKLLILKYCCCYCCIHDQFLTVRIFYVDFLMLALLTAPEITDFFVYANFVKIAEVFYC